MLQDRVPAFSSDRAIATVEKELGAPVTQLFRSFERSPIAAASLGQVSDRTALSASEPVPYAADRPPPCLQHLSQASLQDLACHCAGTTCCVVLAMMNCNISPLLPLNCRCIRMKSRYDAHAVPLQ